MRTAVVGTILLVSGLLAPELALAQAPNGVVVLYNGGVETVDVFDLAEGSVVAGGALRIVPEAAAPARVSDIKILPDGSYLLADVDGRGAAVTTPSGEEFRWVQDDLQRFIDVDSASVGSYFAAGEPSVVATGDSSAANIALRGTSQSNVVWFDTVRITASRALVPQVVVLPDNRLAAAVNWVDIAISGVEIRDTSEPLGDETSLVSETWAEFGANAIVVPELSTIRDMMGTEDGTLLVTTRFDILEMSLTGEILDRVGIEDHPELSGELASTRILPSGLWAVATFRPGEWITPSTDHRVHWYDPNTRSVVATTEALQRAPLRVEPVDGHGGTGTSGFEAGLDAIARGNPDDVQLTSLVAPPTVRVGERLTTRATVLNNGDAPVGLVSVTIRGHEGECNPDEVATFDFAEARSVALQSLQAYTFEGMPVVDSLLAVGQWCVFVESVDQQGIVRRYDRTASVRVLEAGGPANSTVDVVDLPFGPLPDAGIGGDAGADGGDAGMDVDDGAGGCCATASGRAANELYGFVLVGLALMARRRPWGAGRGRR